MFASLNTAQKRYVALIVLCLSTFFVGSSVVPLKWVAGQVPVFLATFIRFTVAVVFMVIAYKCVKQPLPSMPKSDWGWLTLTSLCGNMGFMVFMMLSVEYTSALQTGLALGLIPVAVMGLSAIFLGERLGRLGYMAVVFAVLGAMALKSTGDNTTQGTGSLWLGILALTALVFCEAGFAVFGKCVKTTLTGVQKNLTINTITLVLSIPLMLYELQTFDIGSMTDENWYAIIYVGLFATGVAGIIWFWAMKHVRANDAGIATAFMPLFGAVGAVVVLDEVLLPVHIVGGIFIMVALYLIMKDTPANNHKE